ncbi:MAG: ribonuclease P protein component, partial [Candidatus Saccharimonadales bacterium]
VSKSAVIRNRVRRRIYELVRQYDDPALTGSELVFIVYSDQLATLDSPKLKAAVHDLLARAASSDNRGRTSGRSRGIITTKEER